MLIAIIFFFIIAVVIGVALTSARDSDIETTLVNAVTNSDNAFKISQSYVGKYGIHRNGIAIDEESKKICLMSYKGKNNIVTKFINYSDVLDVEIIENDRKITKGSLLLPKAKTESKVSKIELKIILNDTSYPVHLITFYSNKDGSKKTGIVYEAFTKQVSHWHGLISVLINQAKEQDRTNEVAATSTDARNNSIADELMKLSELQKQGIITQEEFDTQKAKLLK